LSEPTVDSGKGLVNLTLWRLFHSSLLLGYRYLQIVNGLRLFGRVKHQ